MTSTILFEEKLCKKGKINKSWKNRWCVLRNKNNEDIVLEYYDGRFEKFNRKLCGKIQISLAYGIDIIADAQVISLIEQIPDNVIIKEEIKCDKSFSFRIKTPNRKYIFSALDSNTFLKWIHIFDQIIYGGIIKQGWLKKRGGKNKSWKKRYFVINMYQQIKYYKDHNKKSLCGIIPLRKVIKINNGSTKPNKNKYVFHVATTDRTFILCAREMQERVKLIFYFIFLCL